MASASSRGDKPLMRTSDLEIDDGHEQELSRFQLLVLTCTLGGLQVVWSILNGNVNVFLLSIGIPASISPLIWVIAPVCGTIVQPLVGWLSDQTQSKYGCRRPYVLFGTVATVLSLVGLSWSQNAALMVSSAENAASVTTGITIVWVVLLNISIQPLQMGVRALVMDACPKAQQPQANAWAGCAASIGNVLGYLVSFTTSTTSVHVLGFGHFKYLAVIASLCLSATVALNLFLTDTRSQPPSAQTPTITLQTLIHHFRHSTLISTRTRIINRIQFCAWMGWFPFLFYMTAFVSNLSPQTKTKTATTNATSQPQTHAPGALAGFLYALISCLTSLIIPQLLHRTKFATASMRTSSTAPIATLFGLSLEEIWLTGQTTFGILMFATVFASTPASAITIIALAGIPWALANYIPFALIGVEVAEQRTWHSDELILDTDAFIFGPDADHNNNNDDDDDDDDDDGNPIRNSSIDKPLHHSTPRHTATSPDSSGSSSSSSSGSRTNPSPIRTESTNANANETASFGTGATIGLHNAAISAPQILAALLSAGILALCARILGDSTSDNGHVDASTALGVAWVMRLSGIAACVAAWEVRRLF